MGPVSQRAETTERRGYGTSATTRLTEVFRFGAQDLSNGVPGVAFSPEGDRLVAADWLINSAKVFDLRPEGASELAGFQTLPGCVGYDVHARPDGIDHRCR